MSDDNPLANVIPLYTINSPKWRRLTFPVNGKRWATRWRISAGGLDLQARQGKGLHWDEIMDDSVYLEAIEYLKRKRRIWDVGGALLGEIKR